MKVAPAHAARIDAAIAMVAMVVALGVSRSAGAADNPPDVDAATRFAVVIGTNEGESDEAPLRWAERDASRMADVLTRLGGVAPERLVLLRGASRGDVLRALASFAPRVASVRAAGGRVLLVVYYAGHAGAGALHLGGSTLGYDELRAAASQVGADVRLLVLDACRSGGMTRVRGARPAAPFDLSAADRMDSHGEAILTSSAAGEDAQESDRLGGGIFTHHLLMGLRGAADSSGDGAITLGEAWRYAYAQTLHSSSRTAALQHPTYAFAVRGRSEPVLTRVADAAGSARLVLQQGGSWMLFHGGPGGEATEVVARPETALVLPAGLWLARRRDASGVAEATVRLRAGTSTTLGAEQMRLQPYGQTVRRGLAQRSALAVTASAGASAAPLDDLGPAATAAGGARVELAGVALEIALRWSQASASQSHMTMRHSTLGLELGATHLFDLGRSFAFGLGVRAGVDAIWQRFDTTGLAPDRDGIGARLAPTVRIEWAPAPRHVVAANCAVDVWTLKRADSDGGTSWQPEVVPGCGLTWSVYVR